jgi:hypothetical protein
MLAVVVADRSLALYLPNETGWSLNWRLNAQIPSPSQYPFIFNPEYFDFPRQVISAFRYRQLK